jgi:hypothetical protein
MSIINSNGREQYRPTISIKWVIGYIIIFSMLLIVMWIGQWLMFVIKGEVPKIIQDTGGLTHLVAALDLSMIVSPLIIGVIWMLKYRELGYIISAILMIQCTLTCIVLIVTAPFQSIANVADAWTMFPLWIITGVGCFVSSIVLLRNVRLLKSIK